MRICLIHGRRKARKVLARAFFLKLDAEEVTSFSSCERVLASSLDGYDVFVVYGNGQGKTSGVGEIRSIRSRRPDAFIVGVVSSTPNLDRQTILAGADTLVLRTEPETTRMISATEIKKLVGTIWKGADKP